MNRRQSILLSGLLAGITILTALTGTTLPAGSAPAPTPVGTPYFIPNIQRSVRTSAPVGEMIKISAGTFQMGCNAGAPGCSVDAQPLHTVYLSAYAIDKYEVTNALYQRCVRDGGCVKPYSSSSATRDDYYGNPAFADYPVIKVNWSQAAAFCAWAGKRLPTEAEWEKAARGSTDTRTYPWGDSKPSCSKLNYAAEATGACVGDTNAVGSYVAGASPYGVMDMAGNAWEWVNDWWQVDYYSQSPAKDPPGPFSGLSRVIRGGAWNHISDWNVRVATRGYTNADFWVMNLGFRCAQSQ